MSKTGGGISIRKFIQLIDVISSYAGKGLNVLRIKTTEDGVEAVAPALFLAQNPLTVNLDADSHKITNLTDGTADKDAVNYGQLQQATEWYGVGWDITNSNPVVTRIAGNMGLHVELPIHSLIKGCLVDDTGIVNYYLDPSDWTKKENGDPSDLTGTDGMVMVEIPQYYRRFEAIGNYRSVKLSMYALPGYTEVGKAYISAYEAALNRTTSKLASVVNTTPDYRGGNNTSAWDAAVNTLLGRPVTNTSRTNFRTYAQNRGSGWEMYNYEAHKNLFWLFITEYATRNSQTAVNAAVSIEGYKQGGLGIGVTDAISAEWNTFSSYNPFIACGASNSLANGTGEVSVVVTDFGGIGVDRTFTVNRYRGIEMPFGHIWKNCDGVNINIQAVADGDESQVWIASDPADWNDNNYTNYANKGNIARASGYMSKALFGNAGEFVPEIAVGGSTTYFCDYFYTSIPASGESLRTLRMGGDADNGSNAGLASSDSNNAPSTAHAYIGSRFCFLGA